MTALIGALIVMLALKLAEGHGSLEFEPRSGGIIVVTLAYLVASWLIGSLAGLAFLAIDLPAGFEGRFAFGLAMQFLITLLSVLAACVLLPGVHVRRFTGIVLAAALIVAINYFAIAAIAGI